MDLTDISEYFMLHIFGVRSGKEFAEREGIYSIATVYNLLKVKHYLHIHGHCWTKDISDSLVQKDKTYKRVEIGMYFLQERRFVREVNKDKVLGKSWVLTNKGDNILEKYAAHLRDQQQVVNYRIKKSHKQSRELKEND